MKHKFGKTVVTLLASTVLLAACGSKILHQALIMN